MGREGEGYLDDLRPELSGIDGKRGGGDLDERGLELSGIGGKRGIDLPCYKKPNEYRWDEGGGRRRRRRRRRNLTTPT